MSAERDGGVVYLDASALVKLVLPEEESAALVGALADTRELVTSVVGAVETRRAVLGATAGIRNVFRTAERLERERKAQKASPPET